MSFTVLMIGMAHAAPPLLGAVVTQKKWGVLAGAVISATIAFISGRDAYVIIDLAGLALGVWAGLSIIKNGAQAS